MPPLTASSIAENSLALSSLYLPFQVLKVASIYLPLYQIKPSILKLSLLAMIEALNTDLIALVWNLFSFSSSIPWPGKSNTVHSIPYTAQHPGVAQYTLPATDSQEWATGVAHIPLGVPYNTKSFSAWLIIKLFISQPLLEKPTTFSEVNSQGFGF